MSTKLSARVILKSDDGETHVDFFVRSVRRDSKLFDPAAAVDGWAAYCETPVLDHRRHLMVERVSVAPRATPEEAAADMYPAIRVWLEKTGARLAWGEIPEEPLLVGPDPMGDGPEPAS